MIFKQTTVLALSTLSAGATIKGIVSRSSHTEADGFGEIAVTQNVAHRPLVVNEGSRGQTDFLNSICPDGRCWENLLPVLGLDSESLETEGVMVSSPFDLEVLLTVGASPYLLQADALSILDDPTPFLPVTHHNDNHAGPDLAHSFLHTGLDNEATDEAMIKLAQNFLGVSLEQQKVSRLPTSKILHDLGISDVIHISCDQGYSCHIAEPDTCPNPHVEPAKSGTANGPKFIHCQGYIYDGDCSIRAPCTSNSPSNSGHLDAGLNNKDSLTLHGQVYSKQGIWNPTADAVFTTHVLLASHKSWDLKILIDNL